MYYLPVRERAAFMIIDGNSFKQIDMSIRIGVRRKLMFVTFFTCSLLLYVLTGFITCVLVP